MHNAVHYQTFDITIPLFFHSQMCLKTFQQLLHEQAITNLHSTGGRQTLRIRRKHIWTDTKLAFSQEGFICNVALSIKFDGEEAVDRGGPLQEYFELLWNTLQCNAYLFTGPDYCRILTHNTHALNNNEFRSFGMCIAFALICGGCLPHFLSQAVLTYVLDQKMGMETIDEIPNEVYKEIVKKLCCV